MKLQKRIERASESVEFMSRTKSFGQDSTLRARVMHLPIWRCLRQEYLELFGSPSLSTRFLHNFSIVAERCSIGAKDVSVAFTWRSRLARLPKLIHSFLVCSNATSFLHSPSSLRQQHQATPGAPTTPACPCPKRNQT